LVCLVKCTFGENYPTNCNDSASTLLSSSSLGEVCLVSCSEVCQDGSEGYSEDYEARAWGDDLKILKPGEAGLVFTSAIHCLDDHMISYGS